MHYTRAQTADLLTRPLRYLLVDQTDHVLTVTLNRPEKKNALHPPLLAELAFTLAYAQDTPAVWVVVLAAAGNVFCAGMDLKALTAGDTEALNPATVGQAVPEPDGPIRVGELMAALHKPCIVRIQGPVYAGGLLLVGGATYAVAAETATFSLPEVKRGLFPFQVLAVLTNLMPARKALDLCLRGQTLTANEAMNIGLVTQVVSPDDLDNAIATLVTELKQGSPTALRFGMEAYQALKSIPVSEQQAFLYEQFTRIQQTDDAREGMAAFLEKRAPVWQNQ
ncbi:enoyl-CoA hydratase-related protein [Fibrella aquatica]|jgi:enoyl-CoA hydratase/carnithine racemase|uniref:enoyl-CoA hydratase-related protein n=1 Tax=Fibrella aquatica TaxID=3242487 RepID=UPI00351F857C